MKKFDRLLISSFIPPFIVTFFIALFVFVLQTLWLYIDDIAGKGVGIFLVVELVGYLSVSMIPLALPVAVLISSVMVLGNLAERYELSSMKSAGISLWRTMKPLMFLTLGIGVFSFFCSNYFIPVSNLKFKSRLYDIRQQKPTLSLQESIFNNDFQGYSIRIGDKLPDNRSIRNVLIYDNTEAGMGRLQLVTADSGIMYGSPDKKFFVMELYGGHQYLEPKPVIKSGRRNYPLMRATYKQWTKVFNLDEFELDRTDESLFKSNYAMLNNRQLLIAIDSIDAEMDRKVNRMSRTTHQFFYFWEKAYQEREREKNQREVEERRAKMLAEKDSILQAAAKAATTPPPPPTLTDDPVAEPPPTPSAADSLQAQHSSPPPAIGKRFITKQEDLQQPTIIRTPRPGISRSMPWPQTIEKDLKEYDSFIQLFPHDKQSEMRSGVLSTSRTMIDQAATTLASLSSSKKSRVKHLFEFNNKFSLAVACFIFLFIGAPMGAIVRKGGFGWPLLISISFFMLFITITIFSKGIAERFVINTVLASWLNCLVIFPMGLLLTFWAMRDTNLTQLADYFKIKLPSINLKLLKSPH